MGGGPGTRHGLLKASFSPPEPVREVRALTRSQATLVAERTPAVNRRHKLLEGANLKRGAVASDVLGKSGRARLEAILAGEGDPQTLAERARGRLRAKLPVLRQALDGRVHAFPRVVLRHLRDQMDFLERQVAQLVVRDRGTTGTRGRGRGAAGDHARCGAHRCHHHRRRARRRPEPLRLGLRCPTSWPPGPASVQGTSRAPASRAPASGWAARPPTGIPGCRRS